ncbi:MAG: hypothetical protein IJS14_08470 [Lentisphaeria bacterium]|nr:hypothetical protein [Lentisphaeria bacterium]
MKTIKSGFFAFFRSFAVGILLFLTFSLSAAGKLVCSQCGRTIHPGYSYLQSKGKIFCSEKCFEQILPECTICGRRSHTGGIYAMDHSFFACTQCMKYPRCFACQFPVPNGTKLSCDRVICPKCARTAISDPAQAQAVFDEVRNTMRFSLGIVTKHPITFSLVDPVTLHRLSGARNEQMSEQGLFRYNAEVERVSTRNFFGRKTGENVYKKREDIRIFVLDHLPRIRMEHVIAHELAHDWMTAFYPGIKEDWIKEGFAEYIAWRYNQYKKRNEMNRRVENNPDPVYGEGFRKIRDIAKQRGFGGLRKFLESKSKMNKKK